MAASIETLVALSLKLEGFAAKLRGSGELDPELLQTVQELTSLFREQLYRETAGENIFQNLLQILSKAVNEIELASKNSSKLLDTWLQLTTECFRCQRNACVMCTKNQCIMRNLGLIDVSVCLIRILHGKNDQVSFLTAFRCGLQFLGNMAAGNRDSRNSIWKCTFPDFFLTCLNHEDEKVVSYGSMVLFTCLDSEKVIKLQDHKNLDVAEGVIKSYRKLPESEWLFLTITDHFLKCPELVEVIYAKLSNQERITLLDVILSKLSERERPTSDETLIPLKLAEFLISCFQETCKDVLKLASGTSTDDEESLVVIRLLDVICEMTCKSKQLECLQNCPDLLETVIDILRLTHFAGKQNKNIFTSSHSMSGMEEVSHPAVGFKGHLIRLIANLCYKNKNNQDKVFHLDGIPLILDNCSIDDNNPFLNQWAVYAIRNLTEQNEKNQEVIAKMERQGLADDSFLKSMGLEVEERDGKLLLKSLKKDS